MILAMGLRFFAFAAETVTPPIDTRAPKDSSRDVRIHFYIDAHKSMLTGDAYKRAANGLKIMLDDIANPIKKGLRDRMIGERVEINTGTAYLIKPKEIVPFSLSGEITLPRVKSEDGKWDLVSLVKMILNGPEKESRNVVVCVITNDLNLNPEKYGVFNEVKDRGLIFFVLYAPKESVDGPIWHPYWKNDEWARFLGDAVGASANDVANSIVDRYYNLSEAEISKLESITCEQVERKIAIKRIHSLPEKDMWQSTITVNGKAVHCEDDSALVDPEVGQNKVVVSVESPTGICYTRIWDGKDMTYFSLGEDKELLRNAKKVLADAANNNVTNVLQGTLAEELRAGVDSPGSPMTKAAMEAFKAKVEEFQQKVWLNIGLQELLKKIMSAGKLLEAIKGLDKKNAYLAERTEAIGLLKKYKELNEKSGATDIETAKRKMDNAIKRLADIKVELERAADQERREAELAKGLAQGRTKLLADIDKCRKSVVDEGCRNNKTCGNLEVLDEFKTRAQAAEGTNELHAVNEAFGRWEPEWKDVEPPVTNVVEDVAEATNVSEKVGSDPQTNTVDKSDAGGDGGGGLGWGVAVLVLLIVIAVARKLLMHPVAVVSYEAADSTDGAVSVEARKKQVVRLDESLGCQIDVRVICQKNESGSMDFVVTSPNKGVWLQKLGGDNKKPVAETGMPFEEGKYQLFDNEFAMSAVGTIEFESKIN
ncbi:MAG: hypothetical protein MJ249_10300 [Kiritimatiellae bacterium]|nr:hypothetical protein [Kiritimatiellia bacterium]